MLGIYATSHAAVTSLETSLAGRPKYLTTPSPVHPPSPPPPPPPYHPPLFPSFLSISGGFQIFTKINNRKETDSLNISCRHRRRRHYYLRKNCNPTPVPIRMFCVVCLFCFFSQTFTTHTTHTRTHARTRTHAHTHARTHAHTHTHTHRENKKKNVTATSCVFAAPTCWLLVRYPSQQEPALLSITDTGG